VEASLLGVAALVASISGLVSTIIGVRRARRDEKDQSSEQCRERLRAARAEAEHLAEALHEIRMTALREDHDAISKIDDVLERWTHLE